MTKNCYFCNKQLVWPEINSCYYCQNNFCDDHRIAENHDCPKVIAAKHIEKDYLRKKGVNITTGRYAVICKDCGFKTEYMDIEEANQKRIKHIHDAMCSEKMILLRQHEEDRKADDEFMKTASIQEGEDWMYQCLAEAKSIIKRFHKEIDAKSFFDSTTYELFVQNDNQNAFAYITLIGDTTHFPIGIHPILSENTPQNQRDLVIVLVHELLHAIHPGWNHDMINPQEDRLANLACYFDALVDLRNKATSGGMRID